MREKYGAKSPRSWLMRFHSQTAGVSLTAQQPDNNIVPRCDPGAGSGAGRHPVAAHQLAWTRRWRCPLNGRSRLRLRTQQIIAEESGVANTIDPLAGSYFVEALTNRMEEEANAYFRQIERLGGVIPAIEHGFFQREIADAAYVYQREIDDGRRTIVGVNDYVSDEPGARFRSWPWIRKATSGRQRASAACDRARRLRSSTRRCIGWPMPRATKKST